MTSDAYVIGCIRIQPPLNEAEQRFLLDLIESGRTLRGTPTGRGDNQVPFARLAWDVCPDGCCLAWDPDLEDAKWMAASLRFVVDHLLRAGARAEGRPKFAEFTFDHVLEGTVMGVADAGQVRLVEVSGNVVQDRAVLGPCDEARGSRPSRSAGLPAGSGARGSQRALPSNVIEFRPRGA